MAISPSIAEKCSPDVVTWLNAESQPEEKPVSLRLVIDGYRDATAGTKPFMPHGKPMFILAIGDNSKCEKAAKDALTGLQIPMGTCQGGGITVEATRSQLQSALETGKFRSVRLSSECAVQPVSRNSL